MRLSTKILSVCAVGLIATLLFAGAVMANGPTGADTDKNVISDTCGSCDRDQIRDHDRSCDQVPLRTQDRACTCSTVCSADGTMLQERICLEDGQCGGDMVRLRDCGENTRAM